MVGYRVDPTVRVVRVSQQSQAGGCVIVEAQFHLDAFSCSDNAA